jgi:F-type H+-transporting ATPase subunit a
VWKISSIPIGNVLVLFVSVIWKLFDLAIGGIQAFIFALLTILYFDVAMSTEHDGHAEKGEIDLVRPSADPVLAPQDH